MKIDKWVYWMLLICVLSCLALAGCQSTPDSKESFVDFISNTDSKAVLNDEKFAKIQEGMSLEEVTSIIGDEPVRGWKSKDGSNDVYEYPGEGNQSSYSLYYKNNKLVKKQYSDDLFKS